MKKIIIIIVAVISGATGYLLLQDNNETQTPEQGMGNAAGTMLAGSDAALNPDMIGGDAVAPEQAEGEVSYSIIYDAEYGFSPATITAQEGDEVSINLRSASGTTNLLIDELGVVTPVMTPDSGDTTVSFTVEDAGTYRFYGMWDDELTAEGELVVE